MSNEADSRHTTPTVRWSETVAQVPSGFQTEPSGGKKDTGWVPGVDRPNGAWWNWLHWADGVFHRYVENLLDYLWPDNGMLPNGGSTGGETTAGVGLSVDVAEGVVWLAGAFYVVPAATNLALAAADPTNPRIDLVVARLNAGTPEYFVVTGTPAASPVAPTPSTVQVQVAQVRVNALAVAPSILVDVRVFGDHRVDNARATKILQAGDIGSGNYMLAVDWVNGGAGATVDLGNGQLVVTQSAIVVVPDAVIFDTSITRILDLPASAFVAAGGSPTFNGATWSGVAGDEVNAPVQLHRGCTITEVRIWGTKTGATSPNLVLLLRARLKTDNSVVYTDGPVDNDGDPVGDFMLEITGLSRTIGNQPDQVQVRVQFDDTGGTISLFGGEVVYLESKPFDGI